MNKLAYFLMIVMVGLTLTVVQVETVEADTNVTVDISHCAALPPTTRPQCEADAHSGAGGGDHPCSGMTGDALLTCTEANPPMHHHMDPPSCPGGEEPMCGGVACPTPEQFAADPAAMAPGTEPMCNNNVPALCGDEACGPPPA